MDKDTRIYFKPIGDDVVAMLRVYKDLESTK